MTRPVTFHVVTSIKSLYYYDQIIIGKVRKPQLKSYQLLLTTNQLLDFLSCILKAGIVVYKKQVCPSDIFQDLSVLSSFCVWTDTNHDNSDTFRLKVKMKLEDCCKLT